jgi:capsular exopolysaccharide synthesis family protein
MSRVHRILSKADRDGTTRHIVPALERADLDGFAERRSRFAWNPPEVGVPSQEDEAYAATVAEPEAPRLHEAPAPDRRDPDRHESERADGDRRVADRRDADRLDEAREAGRRLAGGQDLPRISGRPVFGSQLDRDLVAALAPFSPAAEQYRSLRTRIAQIESTGARRVILVTSPGDGDGKTVTAANLALTMAQEFQRQVLLVDADLRDARLHECLGIPREPGLADVLAGDVSLDDALVSLSEYRVLALPAGKPHGRPAELLGSEPMRRLIEGLARRFDRVVIDSTAAHFADAGVVEPMVDGVLLVVRAGRTGRPSIARALGLVPRTKLLGLILNDSRSAGR